MWSPMRIGGSFLATIVMAAGLCGLTANGRAETLAEFYSGKNMRMIIGIPPGGGYDVYARLVARHMPDYIPGHPTFIAQNMPGGGELTAANYIANTAPQDGTVVGAVVRTALFQPLYAEVRRRAFVPAVRAVRIVSGTLPGSAGVVGAVASFKQQYMGSV